MNEQALGKDLAESTLDRKSVRLAWPGLLMRLISVLVIAIGCLMLFFFAVGDMFGESVDPDVVEPVVFEETSAPPATVAEDIPVNSITACINQDVINAAGHPLDPLLEMARNAVKVVEADVKDYEATIIKRVRWKGRLQDEQFVRCKIRHPYCDPVDPDKSIPFSIYTRFLKPKAGQEAIWLEGCYDNKIVAHGPRGLLNVITLQLDPDGSMAMSGNRYSIRSIGMLNLIKQMVEFGEKDKQLGDCEVKISRNIMIGDARCTKLEIIHEEKADQFEFHRAEIYIDDQRNLPIAYRGFLWPDEPGGKPKLLERYLYKDIELNVGLTDHDFDPANEQYKFPGY